MKSVFEEKINAIKNAFDVGISKGKVEVSLLPVVADFLDKHFQMVADADAIYGKELKSIGWRKKGLFQKDQLFHICAAPFIDKAIYRQFVESLHLNYRTMWEMLIFEDQLTDEQILKATGIAVCTEKPSGYRNVMTKATKPRYSIFEAIAPKTYYFGPSSLPVYCFPLLLREQIIGYYDVPKEALLNGMPQPPQTRYLYDKAEALFHQEAIRFVSYYRQGEITETTKGRPALNTMARVNKALNPTEFFEDTPYKLLRYGRTTMLAHWVIRKKTRYETDDLATLLRAQFNDKKINLEIAPSILLHLKGFGTVNNESLFDGVEKKALDLLAQLPHGQWVEFDRVRKYVEHFRIILSPVLYSEVEKLSVDESLTFGPQSGESPKKDHYYHYSGVTWPYYTHIISKPMLDGMFFFFAALGLCDIAYDAVHFEDPDNKHASFWGGLAAVRRTNLGDYVCALTNEYQAPEFENVAILFSPDTLMIQSQGEDKALSALLAPYTEKIGANRYRTDSKIFLKNVRSKKDLETRIVMFKQLVSMKLPDNWEQFFKDLRDKVDPFEELDNVIVLQIPPDNKTLVHLIAHDPVLKGLVRKVEGLAIVVDDKSVAQFRNRLKEFGYLFT